MTEIVLVVSNLLMVVAILAYFYFREVRKGDIFKEEIKRTQEFFEEVTFSKDTSLNEVLENKDKLSSKNLSIFLNHIAGLERSVLPKPVINREAINDILLRTPPLVENEIEKTEGQVAQENFMDVFSRIPVDGNTKIAFEDELENEIDKGGVPPEIID